MNETLTQLVSDPTISRLLILAAGIVMIRVIFSIANRAVTRGVEDPGVRYRSRKAATLVAYAAAAFFTAAVFANRLGGFTVAFGVAGAGIAFALQEVIASVAGWLAVSFGDFYKPGDRIQLGGIRGDVIDIGVLRTTLMECGQWVNGDLYNGRIVRVANSFVFKEPVFNYSADFPFVWDEIMVPIKYGSSYREGREILERVGEEVVGQYARDAEAAWRAMVRKFLIEDAPVAPVVTLQANQNWIELTLRYVVDYKRRRGTRDRLFTRVLEEIDAAEGRVGIAASTLNIEKMPPLEIRVADHRPIAQT